MAMGHSTSLQDQLRIAVKKYIREPTPQNLSESEHSLEALAHSYKEVLKNKIMRVKARA